MWVRPRSPRASHSGTEQMVLQYVESFGPITRGKAAELCLLTPQQATRLLGRLVDRGKLIRIGERKATVYDLPNAVG
ncbi:DNA glycosylase AlkZ-like family protein [Nocardia farcinica]|uniref:DNA glycosylase AlkZ-like family protein n=1 Tax=Nocardia farcinica TaxID=37329 RepID=UPI002454F6BB|nr:crosslink repair DNA glycosylase YcaQ family protein [Nocardia farcinica]